MYRSLLLVLLIVQIQMVATTVEAKPLVDAMLELFDAPHMVDDYNDAPGHFAEKTIEFLAFGDAAMDYYQ
eukprot:jgi/Psemu1/311600/fgenesh1_kg.795_\